MFRSVGVSVELLALKVIESPSVITNPPSGWEIFASGARFTIVTSIVNESVALSSSQTFAVTAIASTLLFASFTIHENTRSGPEISQSSVAMPFPSESTSEIKSQQYLKSSWSAKSVADAKKVCFSISNSPLVKTALAGEDPNWGRIAMAVGKTEIKVDIKKINISFGPYKIFSKNELAKDYDEQKVREYMKNESIEITVDLGMGQKSFTSYTMDLTKDYIEINADYRS